MSLDIETTGLSDSDRIWSTGVTGIDGQAGFEKFSDPRVAGSIESLDDLFIRTSGDFGKEQIQRGSLDPLKAKIASGDVIPEKQLVLETFDKLKGKAILIQNSNFENTKLGNALGDENHGLSDMFRYNTIDAKRPNRKLYVPPEVGNISDKIRELKGYGSGLDDIVPLYNKMFAEYEKEFNIDDGKAFVVELMDYSRGVFAKAAHAGHLDPKLYDANVKIDFLSPLFELGEELHTSLDDGEKQKQIFVNLLGINEELDSGNLSSETTEMFAKMRTGQKEAAIKNFNAGLKNTIGEIDRVGKTRLLSDIPESIMKIDIQGPEGIINREVPRYGAARMTSNKLEAIEHLSMKAARYLDGDSIREAVEAFSTNNNINPEHAKRSLDAVLKQTENAAKAVDNIDLGKFVPPVLKKDGAILSSIILSGAGILAYSVYSGQKNREEKRRKENSPPPVSKKTIFDMYDAPKMRSNEELNKHNYM